MKLYKQFQQHYLCLLIAIAYSWSQWRIWHIWMDSQMPELITASHDDVIKWKHFPRYWPFVRGIHRWIPHTKASDAELWCFLWINSWVNNGEAGNLRCHRPHYDVIVMSPSSSAWVAGRCDSNYKSEFVKPIIQKSSWDTQRENGLSAART